MSDDLSKDWEEDLKRADFEADPGHFDSCYYQVLDLRLEGEFFFIQIRREHPLNGVMIQLGASPVDGRKKGCSYLGCGMKSYEDIRTLFTESEWPVGVTTWDDGCLSVELVMNSDEEFSMLLVFETGDSILNCSTHMFLSDAQAIEFVSLSKEVVKFCEEKISERG